MNWPSTSSVASPQPPRFKRTIRLPTRAAWAARSTARSAMPPRFRRRRPPPAATSTPARATARRRTTNATGSPWLACSTCRTASTCLLDDGSLGPAVHADQRGEPEWRRKPVPQGRRWGPARDRQRPRRSALQCQCARDQEHYVRAEPENRRVHRGVQPEQPRELRELVRRERRLAGDVRTADRLYRRYRSRVDDPELVPDPAP